MAIYQYEQNGEMLWRVYVHARSKTNRTLRVQKRQKGFKTLKEAEREEVKLLRECDREILQIENQAETWGSLVDKLEIELEANSQSLGLSVNSTVEYLGTIKKHTQSWWNRIATEITKGDIRELIQQMKVAGYSASHQRKTKTVVGKVFEYGIENSLLNGLSQSPTIGVDVGREQEKAPEILTLSEIKHLLESAKSLGEEWYPIWAMALLTGMRNGELYALTWKDVSFENNSVSVSKSFSCRFKAIKSTKAGYCRTVPISTELRALLLDLKKEAAANNSEYILPRTWKWTKGDQARELRRFCKGIGLPSVRFHALRACFATQLIRAGVPPIQIQKICGWRDLKTMQRYIRLAGIEIEGATEVLRVLPNSQIFENLSSSMGNSADKRSAA